MALPTLTNVVIESAPDGALGFDVSHPINLQQAKAAFKAGFKFCIRYVPRRDLIHDPVGDPDITFAEAEAILDAGLGLFLVQHVSLAGWLATGDKGKNFGTNAAIYAEHCGFPAGVNIFLDLEEVSATSTAAEIQAYCNEWFLALQSKGYEPGVYVGSKNGLNAEQLFSGTKFRHYWHAASEADPPKPRPGDRGYQMFQPLNLTAAQRSKLTGVNIIGKPSLGSNPAFEVDLEFASASGSEIVIRDVDIDFTIADAKGGSLQWLKR